MENNWRSFFKFDPISPLQKCPDLAFKYFLNRYLLNESLDSRRNLWNLPIPTKILKKQLENGAWPDKSPKRHIKSPTNYLLVETYRNLGILIEIYGFNSTHPQIKSACEYILSNQTRDGDFRGIKVGIYGSQYSTNYTAGLLELLVKASYTEDKRVDKIFQWFLTNQQTEGGLTLPMQTHGVKATEFEEVVNSPNVYPFEPEKPFSHFVTGIVLRAFAAHPTYRQHPDALKAANIITGRFFREDKYSSYKKAECWLQYSYPFWWNDLLAVLDAISTMGLPRSNSNIARALNYYREKQEATGTWEFYILKGKSHPYLNEWLSLVLCRAVKRFFEQSQN